MFFLYSWVVSNFEWQRRGINQQTIYLEIQRIGIYQNIYFPHTHTDDSVTEHTHSFLKVSINELNCNHKTDWDELEHVVVRSYNVFLHSSAGEAPFYLMFEHDAFMPIFFKLLLPKLRYMGNEGCKIYLDAMRKIYIWWQYLVSR